MKNIKDLRIIGIDSARPPKIRAEPYIDLVFRLSDKANKEWCQDFNMIFARADYSVKIDTVECLYIETWVRTMNEIPGHLEMLKEKVSECNQKYYDREVARSQASMSILNDIAGEQGAQGLLNDILAKLNYD
ncbi:MAG: hypothetical protein JXA04_00695 [Gammaproteobacteria bacterium]|nr:hypothetical protein [Gammaproteobacteria bacterium]